jgi:hypothetical protein
MGPCFFRQALYVVITLLALGVWCAWCWSQTAIIVVVVWEPTHNHYCGALEEKHN